MPIIRNARKGRTLVCASSVTPEVAFLIATEIHGKRQYIRCATDPRELADLRVSAGVRIELSGIHAIFYPVDDIMQASTISVMPIVKRIGDALLKAGHPFGTQTMTMHLSSEVIS